MANTAAEGRLFEEQSTTRLLFKLAPPVMLAQLIQALYNVVDSYYVGRFSGDGLTALSVMFPIQLIITAIAVGTGTGLNTEMARLFAQGHPKRAWQMAGTGTVLGAASWAVFALAAVVFLPPYAAVSVRSALGLEYTLTYGTIVCVGSLGIFLESIWSKVHQATGNMALPMAAQVAGALVNILLDPILIFGWGPVPSLGITGAAAATVIGQFLAAAIVGVSAFRRPPRPARLWQCTKRIYRMGYSSIFMQSLFTVYIGALNMILTGFGDEAVTVLGLYYKVQTFFFIPVLGLQTCIVPALSYNYASGRHDRCRRLMIESCLLAMSFMVVGIACFELIPGQLLGLFSRDATVLAIGCTAFRIIGLSFLPAVPSLMSPVFFQAMGCPVPTIMLAMSRQIFCLVPLFWLLSRVSLTYAWFAYPAAELLTTLLALWFYRRHMARLARRPAYDL